MLSLFCCLLIAQVFSQEQQIKNIKDSVPQKDILDVIKKVLGKKETEPANDSITSKPTFSVLPAIGYSYQAHLIGSITGNAAFRFRNAKISTITATASYSQRKQIVLPVQSNIWLNDNKMNLLGDFRFYHYPQATYGLGSNTSIKDEAQMVYNYLRLSEIFLRRIKGDFYAGIGVITDQHWSIKGDTLTMNNHVNDYYKYAPATHTASTGFTLNSVLDQRDNPINPGKGAYVNVQLRTSFTALGSTNNWQSVTVDARKYFNLSSTSRSILAFWSYNWLVLHGEPPYFDLPSNGWDTYLVSGRGYIQSRFRGTKMLYAEAEYRYGITRNGLLGGVIFANAETFSAGAGSKLQNLQPAAGLGLRIKANKTSNTNIAIDYGFGNQGSGGLFLAVGEIF